MRAVNLMPRDARGTSGGAAPQSSGTGVYVLLAGLAALVLCAAVWAMADKQAGERQAKLTRVTAQAAAAEKRASAAAPYVAFQRMARDRVQTVTTLSSTRFDWAHAMREISRVVPADVWLQTLSGASGAGSGAPSPTTSAAPAPTITIDGCTHSQAKVARLMARLRTIDGVRKIALKSSEKPATKGDDACPANRESDPHFTIAVSFAVPGAPRDRVDDTGQVTTPGAASAVPAGGQAARSAEAVSVATPDRDG
ncbi:MAG: PilN domain-containing protein [Solirubrobacterales bacterium]|nr:PilN domain-containing protein [Solirubrobacterales bacterium]